MYKTINGFTKKSMIEMIYKGNNGTKSQTSGKVTALCQYKTEDGNHCAVGCFIPDELYDPMMDGGYNPNGLVNEFKLEAFMPLNICGLTMLQRVHDSWPHPTDVREALAEWINNNVIDSE